MRAYGKEWDCNVYSCIYCLYWKGKRIGCVYPAGCCRSVPQKPPVRLGQKIVYPKKTKTHKPVSKCENCP